MKKLCFSLLALSLLFCLSFSCSAEPITTSYYVNSETGDDSNDGLSPDTPWKTVVNLSELDLQAGDSVLFARGGSYECNCWTLTCSGTEEQPILISAYGDSTADRPLLYTEQKTEVLRLFDCSYVTVSEFEITAHNGGGIWIDTRTQTSTGITLTGLEMHDMQNWNQLSRDDTYNGAAVARACVMVKGLPARSRFAVNDLTITDCEMYDVGNGINLWGSLNDAQKPVIETDEDYDPIFNENAYIENVYFHDMTAEALIIGICRNAFVTNCRAINCCQDVGLDKDGNVLVFTAAMWFWGSVYSTIDHCEIAGQKNAEDGMTVDFDSYSHHCTYQYIYSHDNTCFMKNNALYDGQRGNCVHHCLSVNDGGSEIRFSKAAGEYEFQFYNNTIVNCGNINLANLTDSKVCNNIFMPKAGCLVRYELGELFRSANNIYSNNCYYRCLPPLLEQSSLMLDPGFVSADASDPNSFKLSTCSLLLGNGCDTGTAEECDFYGNSIEQNNIGCYGGKGEEKQVTFADRIREIVSGFSELLKEIKPHRKLIF